MNAASMTIAAATSRPQRGRPAGIPASSAILRTAGLFPACPGMLRWSASAKPAVRKRRSIPTVRSALRKMQTSPPAKAQRKPPASVRNYAALML